MGRLNAKDEIVEQADSSAALRVPPAPASRSQEQVPKVEATVPAAAAHPIAQEQSQGMIQ